MINFNNIFDISYKEQSQEQQDIFSIEEQVNNGWKYVKPLKDPKSIDKFESKHGIKFPKDLKEIFLKYNGGRPPKRYFDVGKEKDIEFKTLLSFNKDDPENIYTSLDTSDNKLIPFASTPGGDFICLKSNKIYFWIQDTDKSVLIASTFTEFLKMLNDGE